jgi:hypothetical protein
MKPTLILLLLAAACSTPRTRGWIGGEYRRVDGLGLLIVDAPAGTPVAAAGLRPGDVVTTLDEAPVPCARRFRRAIGSRAPGADVELTYWREGATARARVRVGEATVRRARTLTVGLALSPRLDLWPFDDGIEIFGLVRLRPGDLFVVPFGLAWSDETVRTRPTAAAPPRGRSS